MTKNQKSQIAVLKNICDYCSKNNKVFRLKQIAVVVIIIYKIFAVGHVFAAPVNNKQLQVKQHDGKSLVIYITGDENYIKMHDENGYTILFDDSTQNYVYADIQNNRLVPTEYIAGSINPESLNIKKNLVDSPEIIRQKSINFTLDGYTSKPSPKSEKLQSGKLDNVNNIVIFIKFADDTSKFVNETFYNSKFNDINSNSMYCYLKSISFNKVNVLSEFYPRDNSGKLIWYVDSKPRNYYISYSSTNKTGYSGNTERKNREQDLLERIIKYTDSQISNSPNYDNNNDGFIDNICFVVSGKAVISKNSEILWPHKWSFYDKNVYLKGKQVMIYNMIPEDYSGVGVLSHEMLHTLGAPDLYHYSYDSYVPVGEWDVMANTNYDYPQNTSTYIKQSYLGWIDNIPEITNTCTYTLNPSTSPNNNCFKIKSPYSSNEYYVLEYRIKSDSSDNAIPGSGLLVYRINTDLYGYGNRNGSPDEVYIFRPNGTIDFNSTIKFANFCKEKNRTSIGYNSNPKIFLSDGTYENISITDIGNCDSTIKFYVTIPGSVPCITDVEDNENENLQIHLFPNPAINTINIGLEYYNITKIQIVDMMGKTVKNIENIQLQNNSMTIDIIELANGIYNVIIISDNQIITKKFVKM
jgi:M6 family metalloprotease-like protein